MRLLLPGSCPDLNCAPQPVLQLGHPLELLYKNAQHSKRLHQRVRSCGGGAVGCFVEAHDVMYTPCVGRPHQHELPSKNIVNRLFYFN